MLKVFRDNLKHLKWVLWLVVLVFVVFLFTDFGAISPVGTVSTTAAATVGDYEISYAEFQQAYRQQEAQIAQAYGGQLDSDLARQIGLPRQVMEFLVAEKILLAEGERMGLQVTDEEVRERILEFPVFQDASGNFVGEDDYQSILRSNRMTSAAFEQDIRNEILGNRIRSILNDNVYVSDQEVEQSYREQAERVRIRYIPVAGADFAEGVQFDDAELADYFAQNRLDFEVSEQRIVDYLLIDPADLQQSIQISDDEVLAYYRENESDYTSEEQVKARHILARTGDDRTLEQATAAIAAARARIDAGEDFAAVAAEVSDDPGSKTNGGDLGFFGRGQMVGPFETAAFSAAVGDLVGPVETSFGVHLIEVLDRSEGGAQPLEQVSTSIRNRLASERASALAETKASELKERIERENLADSESLRALAEGEEGVSFSTSPPFGETGRVEGLGRAPAFKNAAFDLGIGEISDAIQISSGWTILRLDEIRPERLPELAEVTDEVRTALRRSRELDLATAALLEARERIEGGATFEQIAADLDVEIQESGDFGATGTIGQLGSNPELASAALALDAGDIGGPIRHNRQSVLFEVVERKRFDAAEFEQQKASTRSQLVSTRATEVLSSLVEARRAELGVQYDPTFIENFELSGS